MLSHFPILSKIILMFYSTQGFILLLCLLCLNCLKAIALVYFIMTRMSGERVRIYWQSSSPPHHVLKHMLPLSYNRSCLCSCAATSLLSERQPQLPQMGRESTSSFLPHMPLLTYLVYKMKSDC